MSLTISDEPVPLEINEDGVVRVNGTRVTLDTIVAAFNEGATAEEIVYQYPSLNLTDVYMVISYYLRHRSEVEKYLRQRHQEATFIRQQNEARYPPNGIRDRLEARRTFSESLSYAYY